SVAFADPTGRTHEREYAVDEAVRELVGDSPHLTRRLQKITLEMPGPKGRKVLQLVDTSGLADGIHPNPDIRRAMAQTLYTVREAAVILHLVDAVLAGRAGPFAALGEVD